jgi:hypothetical protein
MVEVRTLATPAPSGVLPTPLARHLAVTSSDNGLVYLGLADEAGTVIALAGLKPAEVIGLAHDLVSTASLVMRVATAEPAGRA